MIPTILLSVLAFTTPPQITVLNADTGQPASGRVIFKTAENGDILSDQTIDLMGRVNAPGTGSFYIRVVPESRRFAEYKGMTDIPKSGMIIKLQIRKVLTAIPLSPTWIGSPTLVYNPFTGWYEQQIEWFATYPPEVMCEPEGGSHNCERQLSPCSPCEPLPPAAPCQPDHFYCVPPVDRIYR